MSAYLLKTVLIVDDDPEIRTALNHYLGGEGFTIEVAADGKQMAEILAESTVDMVVLDLGLHNESGLDLLKDIVSESDVAVVILTGNADPIERVVALELGADDYIVKPFLKRELLARINAVLRRTGNRQPATPYNSEQDTSRSIRVNNWLMDMNMRQVQTTDGSRIPLTGTEFDILVALAQKVGEAITRNEISKQALNREWDPSDRSVDIHIHNLRRKLSSGTSCNEAIVAVRNVGYLLAAEVTPG